MRNLILFITISLTSQFAKGQKGNIWLGGENAGIDFNATAPISFFRSENSLIWRTSASICDTNGNLLFYTNGFRVYNRNFEIMQNGDSLSIGDYLSFGYDLLALPDGAVIIPYPGNPDKYYLFHFDNNYNLINSAQWLFPNHLFYSIIDMTLNDGLGAIVENNKDLILLTDTLCMFGIQTVKHGNGSDWWLICHEYGSNRYYEFLIDKGGIHGPYSMNIGMRYELVNAQVSSPMKFSTDGSLFVHQSRDSNIVELFDFDRCSGELYNYRNFMINNTWVPVRGVSISPSKHYLYVSSNFNEILQFDLQANDIYQSRLLVGTDDGIFDPFQANYYLHQLGPDGRIYITSYDECYSMHVINKPDSGGVSCNFVQRGFPLLNGTSWFGGVPNIPNYLVGPLYGSGCDTLSAISYPSSAVFTCDVYPNPCYNTTQVSISGATSKAEVFLYDTFGQLLFYTTSLPMNEFIHESLPVKSLSSGVYLVKVKIGKKNITQKLVKD